MQNPSCQQFRRKGVGRRDFFRIGGTSLFGLTMADMLAGRAHAAAPKPKADHMILVWLGGGPPHQDTFDMKPDAPAEIRGEFKPIKTNVSGIEICELLPRLAKLADKYTLLRSCGIGSERWEHGGGQYWLTGNPRKTGSTPAYPMYGNVIAKERAAGGGLPSFVVFGGIPGGTRMKSQYLGPAYDPLDISVGGGGETMGTLIPPAEMTVEKFNRRESLRTKLDQKLRQQDQADKVIASLDQYQQTAFELLRSPKLRDALDLGKEKPAVVARYGKSNQCQKLLAARRLVEAGVPFVSFQFEVSWDHHGNRFGSCRVNLPNLDSAVASLIEDLDERGLLQRTIVAVLGEMGRTPRINKGGGRDHWGKMQSILVAGGGFAGGVAVGATDEHAGYATENYYKVESFGTTLYHLLGIDPGTYFTRLTGQPIRLIEEPAPLIKEALA